GSLQQAGNVIGAANVFVELGVGKHNGGNFGLVGEVNFQADHIQVEHFSFFDDNGKVFGQISVLGNDQNLFAQRQFGVLEQKISVGISCAPDSLVVLDKEFSFRERAVGVRVNYFPGNSCFLRKKWTKRKNRDQRSK